MNPNIIYNTVPGARHILFERFGFNLQSEHPSEFSNVTFVQNLDGWNFTIACYDWVNVEKAEILTEYRPRRMLLEMLRCNIDAGLE